MPSAPLPPSATELLRMAAGEMLGQVRYPAVFLLDARGRIASWCHGVERLLGWDREAWITRAVDESSALLQAPLAQAAASGWAVDEQWMPHKDGRQLRMQSGVSRVNDSQGGLIGFLNVLHNCDESPDAASRPRRDPAQAAVEARDAVLHALLDNVQGYAIFTLDAEGRISSWHRGAEKMMGYSPTEAIGMRFECLFLPQDRALQLPAQELRRAAETGESRYEGLRLRRDGSVFEAAAVLTALRTPEGELLGYLKLTQDVSESKRLEREHAASLEEARSARAEAERIARVKDEFLATISHELRTPLSAIVGWAHVLSRGAADVDTVEHGLAAISRNARAQVHLIEDLLDMSRIEANQLRLEHQRVELSGVIAAAVDAAMPAATAKRISLRTWFGDGAGTVMGDATRLQQVLANLLSNAIKFTPEGGQVQVRLKRHGSQVQIVVSDNGQGIAPDFLPRLFDRFQQQDGSITRRFGGLGLGLAIVKQLVSLHGGRVRAFSRGPGTGATFTVSLPGLPDAPAASPRSGALSPGLEADAAAEAGDDETDEATPRLQGLRLLLVDDETDVRTVIGYLLEQAGAQVLSVASAAEALRLLPRGGVDLVISDIGMPGIDGYELMRRIRALPELQGGATPALALSAYASEADRQRALASGYQQHVAKPVSAARLVAAIAALLGR